MKIESLKDLQAIVALCRKQGVAAIEIDGVKLTLGDEPTKRTYRKTAQLTEEAQPSAPTQEDLLFWSSRQNEINKAS